MQQDSKALDYDKAIKTLVDDFGLQPEEAEIAIDDYSAS